MQLMPATASDMDAAITPADLLVADHNIRVGTKYLKKLMGRFKGNIVYSIAGYNAGPGAVDRWIKEAGEKRNLLEFIESISYKETREYVGAIIRNYYWYSRQINGNFDKDLNYFWNSTEPKVEPTHVPVDPVINLQNESA